MSKHEDVRGRSGSGGVDAGARPRREVSGGPPVRRASGLYPRYAAPLPVALERRGARGDAETTDVVAAVDELVRGGLSADAFHRLVRILDRAIGIRAVGLASTRRGDAPSRVWCKSRARTELAKLEATAGGSATYFEHSHDAPHEVLRTQCDGQVWISAPVVSDGEAVGVLVVASSSGAFAPEASALLASLAGRLVPFFIGEHSGVGADAARTERPPVRPLAKVRRTAGDYAPAPPDWATALGDLVHVTGPRVASGCVVHFLHHDELRRIANVPTRSESLLTPALTPLVAHVMRRARPATAGASSTSGGESEHVPVRGLRAAVAERARRELEMDWVVCVPLATTTALLGTITFMGANGEHPPVPLALAEELGHRAAAGLENARLYSDATKALQDRERVLAMVSHDLNNPLGVILMGASRLLEEFDALAHGAKPSSAERTLTSGRKEIEAIQRSARRMKVLVSDLLALSVIDAGELPMRPTRVDVCGLLHDLLEEMTPQAKAVGVRLELDLPARVPVIWADPHRIAQVITNLVSNALKFTPRGGSVRACARAAGACVELAVVDDGRGIRAEDLPRVFERFWQAPDMAAKGAGLGLAICKSIVERSRGAIRAESQVGRGTTITFTVPTADEAPDSATVLEAAGVVSPGRAHGVPA